MAHEFFQNGHLRPVCGTVRFDVREIVFCPGARGPVSPPDPDVSILSHELKQVLERFQAIRVRSNAKLAEEGLLAVLPRPFGKGSNGRCCRCSVDTSRMGSRGAGVEVLMNLVDHIVLWIIYPLHYLGIWRSIG